MIKLQKLISPITFFVVLIVLTLIFMQYIFNYEQINGATLGDIEEKISRITSFVIITSGTLAVFIHILNSGTFNKRALILIILLSFFMVMSFSYAGWASGSFAIISIPVTFIYLFDILHKNSTGIRTVQLVKYFYSFTIILPVFMYFILPELRESMKSLDGDFIGLESSRTAYGLAACVTLALHLINRQRGWWLFVGLILIGIFLSQSRIAILTSVVVFIFIIYNDDRIKHRRISLFIVGVTTLIFFALFIVFWDRPERIYDESLRFTLLQKHLELVMNNLLFGTGGADIALKTMETKYGIKNGLFPPHNFLIATLRGFGIFVTVIWLALLWYLWKILHKMGRVFIVILLFYGTFHNGFGLSVMNSSNFILFILAVLTSGYFRSLKISYLGKKYRLATVE